MPFPRLFEENTVDGINFNVIERSLETTNLGTASIDPHVEYSILGEIEAANTQLLPVLLSILSAVNLKVRFDVLDHKLHIHCLLVEGLCRPIRVALIGNNRPQIERFLVLALYRTLYPVILRKIDNQSSLVELILWCIPHMRFQNKITTTVHPQTMSVIVTESVVRSLPEITSRIWNEDDLVIFNAVCCGFTKPCKSVRHFI